jgi:hypothetical protein
MAVRTTIQVLLLVVLEGLYWVKSSPLTKIRGREIGFDTILFEPHNIVDRAILAVAEANLGLQLPNA